MKNGGDNLLGKLWSRKEVVFLFCWCLLCFAVYVYFNCLVLRDGGDFSDQTEIIYREKSGPKFASPDETANFFWIKAAAEGRDFYYTEELNSPAAAAGLIHARSFNIVGGKTAPGSFLGMNIFYGFLARVFGMGIVAWLTPFFSAAAIFCFYFLLKNIFGQKMIALISSFLLSFTPGWFYYSARGLYHNVLFLSLLIMGLYFLFLGLDRRSRGHLRAVYLVYFFGGLLVGAALITRSAEAVWVAFSVFLILVFNYKKIYWPALIVWAVGLSLPIISLFYHNQIIYGSYLSFGYRNFSLSGGAMTGEDFGLMARALFVPFGFDWRVIANNVYNYTFRLMPWWTWLTLGGFCFFWGTPERIIKISYKKRLAYGFFSVAVIVYLLVFYGSWELVDRIDKNNVSLGTSYLRYWLPAQLLLLPLAATFIWLTAKFCAGLCGKIFWRRLVYAAMIFFISVMVFLPSVRIIIWRSDESLIMLNNLKETRVKSSLIDDLVDAEDVTVVYRQADKIFFPERPRIITELAVAADYEALARLAKITGINYYTFAPPETVAFISRRDFLPFGLEIVAGRRFFGNDWLYRIKRK